MGIRFEILLLIEKKFKCMLYVLDKLLYYICYMYFFKLFVIFKCFDCCSLEEFKFLLVL